MSFSASTKYKLQKVSFIVLFWVFSLNLYVVVRYYGNAANPGPGALTSAVDTLSLFTLATVMGILIGGVMGVLEIFVYPKTVRQHSFGYGMLLRTIVFVGIVFLANVVGAFIYYEEETIYGNEVLSRLLLYLVSSSFFSSFIYLLAISGLMDFFIRINQRMGPGTVSNLLSGKYFHPREEDRIFMFLDLQSSTHIAEKLGHLKFSLLLQDCFHDLSDLLLRYRASVYQFVGDEAVLTWKCAEGEEDHNCFNLFFEFEALLQSKRVYYQDKYGLIPNFYAAINAGKVTVAEVGDIKSELAYHGDVLNTAARVQKLCKVYKEKLLVTNLIINTDDSNLELVKIDTVKVTGKEEFSDIYAVHKGEKQPKTDSQTLPLAKSLHL
jgi:adenylate cyclase